MKNVWFAACMTLLLCGCASQKIVPAASSVTPDDNTEMSLVQLLSELGEEEIGAIQWLIEREDRPDKAEMADLLNEAAENTIDHDPMTLNGSWTDIIWSLDIFIGDEDAPVWFGEDMLHLYAGLEEDRVEILAGANLTGERIVVESPELYQIVRTSMDTPPKDIDMAVYEAYQETIDRKFLAPRDYGDDITATAELTALYLASEKAEWGVKVYCVGTAVTVDPPEKAPLFLAGGAYVDSRLRIHGVNWQNHLVTADGESVGLCSWESVMPEALARYESGEAFLAHIAGGNA